MVVEVKLMRTPYRGGFRGQVQRLSEGEEKKVGRNESSWLMTEQDYHYIDRFTRCITLHGSE